MDVELEDLIKQYGEEKVQEIIENWQSNSTVHPLSCVVHNVPLKYSYGKLYCPKKNCMYHEHWIPSAVIKHWEAGL